MAKTRLIPFLVFLVVLSSFGSSHYLNQDNNSLPATDSVYAVVDKEPEFPGGNEAKFKFLAEKLSYPAEAKEANKQGRVIVQFVVTETGKVTNVKVVKSVSPSLDKEAIRIVSLFPDWTPGELNGKKVSCYQLVPVTFKVDVMMEHEQPKLVVIDDLKMPLNFDINVLNGGEIDTGYIKKPTTDEIRIQLVNKYGSDAKYGVIEVYTKRFKNFQKKVVRNEWDTIARVDPNDKNAIYSVIEVDKMPALVGGDKKLDQIIQQNLKYPDACMREGIRGTVYVQFVVDKNGKVKDTVVKNKVNSLLAAEALRVVNLIPDWIPAEKHGEKVNVRFTLPIKFRIEEYSYPLECDTLYDGNMAIDRQLIVLDGSVLPYGFDLNWLNLAEIHSYKVVSPKDDKEEKEFRVKFGYHSTKGVFVAISKKSYQNERRDNNGNIIYDVVEQMPMYPGGERELLKFIRSNLINPYIPHSKKTEGMVLVRFAINSFGDIEQVSVLRSLSPECDKEALRVISLMKKWIPGKQNGVPVSVFYALPIRFE
jgi:TonB family protein